MKYLKNQILKNNLLQLSTDQTEGLSLLCKSERDFSTIRTNAPSPVFVSLLFHLRNIAKLRIIVSKSELQMLIHAVIACCLDYCNALFSWPKFLLIACCLLNWCKTLNILEFKILVITFHSIQFYLYSAKSQQGVS